jgi:hypothetical protein
MTQFELVLIISVLMSIIATVKLFIIHLLILKRMVLLLQHQVALKGMKRSLRYYWHFYYVLMVCIYNRLLVSPINLRRCHH